MGAKASTETRVRTYSNVGQGSSAGMEPSGQHAMVNVGGGVGHHGARARPRTRSLGTAVHRGHPLVLTGGSPDSDDSTPEDRPRSRSLVGGGALPQFHLFSFHGIKCPVCSKFIQANDVECHLVMCLTKPRVSYNDDVLQEDKGECVICFEELLQGHTIARLPCLCIYHKTCIDQWFKINRSCPEHPSD